MKVGTWMRRTLLGLCCFISMSAVSTNTAVAASETYTSVNQVSDDGMLLALSVASRRMFCYIADEALDISVGQFYRYIDQKDDLKKLAEQAELDAITYYYSPTVSENIMNNRHGEKAIYERKRAKVLSQHTKQSLYEFMFPLDIKSCLILKAKYLQDFYSAKKSSQ